MDLNSLKFNTGALKNNWVDTDAQGNIKFEKKTNFGRFKAWVMNLFGQGGTKNQGTVNAARAIDQELSKQISSGTLTDDGARNALKFMEELKYRVSYKNDKVQTSIDKLSDNIHQKIIGNKPELSALTMLNNSNFDAVLDRLDSLFPDIEAAMAFLTTYDARGNSLVSHLEKMQLMDKTRLKGKAMTQQINDKFISKGEEPPLSYWNEFRQEWQ